MEESEEQNAPVRPKRPSQIPSWVMLGFVIGAAFVLALPSSPPPPPVLTVHTPTPTPLPRVPETPSFNTIEAVFAEWGKYAVWDHDFTEVALWDPRTKDFSDCYEVFRSGSNYFFRSISRLTRPILTHGVTSESPLRFTETFQQHQEWENEKTAADWKAVVEAARESVGGSGPAPTPTPHP